MPGKLILDATVVPQAIRYPTDLGLLNKARELMQLIALDTTYHIEDLDIAGYRLHRLKGNLKGCWSITVNANWRITFEFTDGNIDIVNYEDYH